ncbi:hypothetical protein GGF31_007451 [Allomyces arbusculus]|nr:hypothetical protein GGF31_007451 [Allomyces arbusculus]
MTSHQAASAEPDLLLAVHNATVTLHDAPDASDAGRQVARGTLHVVQLQMDAVDGDITVLTVGDAFQLQLDAGGSGTLPVARLSPTKFVLTVPAPAAPAAPLHYSLTVETPDAAELDALTDLLVHYTALVAPSDTYRNTVALVDAHGAVVGTLPTQVDASHLPAYDEKAPLLADVDAPAASSASDEKKSVTTSMPPPVVLTGTPDGGVSVWPATAAAATDATSGLSWGDVPPETWIVQGGEKVGSLMVQGASLLAQGIEAAAASMIPTTPKAKEPWVFTPTARENIATAKSVSDAALTVTKSIVDGAVAVASKVGEAVATQLESSSTKPGSKRERGLKFTSAVLKAVGTLTESAAKSGKLVIGATGRSAADYLDHKYGAEAGNVAREVARIGEKVWVVYFDAMGIRRAVLMAGTKSAVHSLHDAKAAAAAGAVKGDGSITFKAPVEKAPVEKAPVPAATTTAAAQPEQSLSETMGPAIILGNKVLVSLASAASSLAKASSEWVAANVQQPPLPPREKS